MPVYNNSEAAVKIVHDLLASQDTRFEIVLSDNASDDDTQKLLSQIHDPRFKYFRNAQNLGAHQNWLHSLELGTGQWLYLVMGRDKLYGENIHSLIDSLEYARKNGVTCVMDSFQKQQGIRIYSGIDAMIKFLKTGHPTGTVIDREIFRELPNTGEYFTHSDMYPENYLRRDMLIKGKGAYINSGVNSLGRINYTKKTSNVDTSRDLWKIFFAPERVIKQSFELIDMVDIDLQDTFTERERSRFFRSSFYWMLIRVSFTWRNHCSNPVLMSHYGLSTRKAGFRELAGNILKAYRETKAHILSNGTYSLKRQLIMYYCTAKIFVTCPAALAAKKILQRSGYWERLREIIKWRM